VNMMAHSFPCIPPSCCVCCCVGFRCRFFLAFVCIGSFFFLNLFVGVVFDQFMKLNRKLEVRPFCFLLCNVLFLQWCSKPPFLARAHAAQCVGVEPPAVWVHVSCSGAVDGWLFDSHSHAPPQGFGMLTDDQREWVEKQNMLLHVSVVRVLEPPTAPWRRKLHMVVQSDVFHGLVMIVIGLSVLAQALTYNGIPAEQEAWLETANLVFTVLFVVEAVMKVAGLTWKGYISDSCVWFVFVFVFVCSCSCSCSFFCSCGWWC